MKIVNKCLIAPILKEILLKNIKNRRKLKTISSIIFYPQCRHNQDRRNQGVDYTCSELSFKLCRINKDKIMSINNNTQNEEGDYTQENVARSIMRKRDNIKTSKEEVKEKLSPRKSYENKLWGIDIKIIERLNNVSDINMNYGIVVTLKEMYGKNRIEEFIKSCFLRGWIVNRIDVENKIDIYNKAEEEVKFD